MKLTAFIALYLIASLCFSLLIGKMIAFGTGSDLENHNRS